MRIMRLLCAALCFFLVVLMYGCQSDEEPILVSIELDSTTILEVFDIDRFEWSNLRLIIHYSDTSSEWIDVDLSMIASTDRLKPSLPGTHDITINYMGLTISHLLTFDYSPLKKTLLAAYDFAVENQGYIGNYASWILSLTGSEQITIISAVFDTRNHLILTLSDERSIDLGKQSIEQTIQITFLDLRGNVIDEYHILPGESVIAPEVEQIDGYIFEGWDQVFTHPMESMVIRPIYTYLNIDSLIISLNRLSQADFSIPIDTIFKNTSQNDQASSHKSMRLYDLFHPSRLQDASYDLDDYIEHPYFYGEFFHKNLYTLAPVVDGMHVISTTLNAFNSHALNNLYQNANQQSESAKSLARWAIQNITVMDTWVQSGEMYYLLHYDALKDRVELYSRWFYEPDGLVSSDKIAIYFNDRGEEVIEFWTTQIYTIGDYYGASYYYNVVASRDFNYYVAWLDENFQPKEDQYHFRGVNLNDQGYYEYYDNHLNMISGDFGWYTVQIGVDQALGDLIIPDNPMIIVYSPDATSNVMFIVRHTGGIEVQLYLPAFDGIDALLTEQGSLVPEPQDMQWAIDDMISKGITPPSDWYVYSRGTYPWKTGIRTEQGVFTNQDEPWQGKVRMLEMATYIGREGERDYSNLHNYYGVLSLNIDESDFTIAMQLLEAYLEHLGISYQYGETQDLILEYQDVYENYTEYAQSMKITQDMMPIDIMPYDSYDHLVDTISYIEAYIYLHLEVTRMFYELPHVTIEEMPELIDNTSLNLIDFSNHIEGLGSIENNEIILSDLVITVDPSPLLQQESSYTLMVGLKTDNRTVLLSMLETQSYEFDTMVFHHLMPISIPSTLSFGTYTLVFYLVKVMGEQTLRVSEIHEVPMILETEIIMDSEVNDSGFVKRIVLREDMEKLMIDIFLHDVESPEIIIDGYASMIQGEGVIDDIWVHHPTTINDFLNLMTVKDNHDRTFDASQFSFYHEGVLIQDPSLSMAQGQYRIEVKDSTGNLTVLHISHLGWMHTVRFIGEQGEVISIQMIHHGEDAHAPIPSEIDGGTFIGWSHVFTNIQSDEDIQALYVYQKYVILYVVDGFSYYEDQDVQHGSILSHPLPPQKLDYRFAGWYDNPLFEGEEVMDDSMTATSHLTLYAKWELKSMKLSVIYYHDQSDDPYRDVFVGRTHSFAITQSGRIIGWGDNTFGQLSASSVRPLTEPIDITEELSMRIPGEIITQFAIGRAHTLVLTESGNIFSFGLNESGQLGTGSLLINSGMITEKFNLLEDETIVSVYASYNHSAALTSLGRVFMWGDNQYGQIGDGTRVNRYLPYNVTPFLGLMPSEYVDSISVGVTHVFVQTSNGRIIGWGDNGEGQLGDGTTTDRLTPVDLTSTLENTQDPIQTIHAGQMTSAYITVGGSIYTWGSNSNYQLGNGNVPNRSLPFNITTNLSLEPGDYVRQLDLGYYFTVILTDQNRIYAWGRNDMGSVGDGTFINRFEPVEITNRMPLMNDEIPLYVSAGRFYTHLLTSNGRIFSWGDNTSYQLGMESYAYIEIPQEMTDSYGLLSGEYIVMMESGSNHYLALTSHDRLLTWGNNEVGQLGYGGTSSFKKPMDITQRLGLLENESITSLYANLNMSCVMTNQGRVFFWGFGSYTQLGSFGTTRNTPVDVTSYFSLNMGETITNLSFGHHAGIAITSNHRVLTWGNQNFGSLGNGFQTFATLSPIDITSRFALSGDDFIKRVYSGDRYQMSISDQGRVFTWGYNFNGQLGDGTRTDRSTPTEITQNIPVSGISIKYVQMNISQVFVITTNQQMLAWGSNIGLLPIHKTDELMIDTQDSYHGLSSNGPTYLTFTPKRVLMWGNAMYGVLGNGSTINQAVPVDVYLPELDENELIIWAEIGKDHVSVLTSYCRVFQWGYNHDGIFDNDKPTEIIVVPFVNKLDRYYDIGDTDLPMIERSGYSFTGMYSSYHYLIQIQMIDTVDDKVVYVKWHISS